MYLKFSKRVDFKYSGHTLKNNVNLMMEVLTNLKVVIN